MKHIGADEFELPDEETVSNPALLIALAGKRCYMSFQKSLNPNLSKIRQDYCDYFDNILASGHGSVLEHVTYSMAIEGISRVFTAEMNRHRAGWAISEGSLRFIRFGENVPYWEPDSIKGPDVGDGDAVAESMVVCIADAAGQPDPEPAATILEDAARACRCSDRLRAQKVDLKKQLSRAVFRAAFSNQEHYYRTLETIWHEELAPESKFAGKKQITSMMRRIIGLGVATGGVWTGNVRALRHVFTMRAAPSAEEEMLHVFSRVAKTMRDKEPRLFGDFVEENGFWRPKYVKV